jgi:hypothetical protein
LYVRVYALRQQQCVIVTLFLDRYVEPVGHGADPNHIFRVPRALVRDVMSLLQQLAAIRTFRDEFHPGEWLEALVMRFFKIWPRQG